ncbi:MAG: patatin-like phospholipase family protein [Pseudomonadota bacterium]
MDDGASRPRIGLALGSGGARGLCHIGVLTELETLGVPIDLIAGTSMGAIVGAVYAGGGLQELHDFVRGLNRARILRMVDLAPGQGGLLGGRALTRVIEGMIDARRFEDLSIPLTVVASDMKTGYETRFNSGPLTPAVRASSAIPAVVRPIRVNGAWYLDGALTNPCPVSVAREMGADIVIAVDPSAHIDGTIWEARQESDLWSAFGDFVEKIPGLPDRWGSLFDIDETRGERGPNLFDVIASTTDIVAEQLRRQHFALYPPDIFLPADLETMRVLDFDRANEAIDEGHRLVKAHADMIRDLTLGKDKSTGV